MTDGQPSAPRGAAVALRGTAPVTEVARQLREEACCPNSLIIGVSGYGDHQAREQARKAGFDHHLVKPVAIEAVTELVSRPGRP